MEHANELSRMRVLRPGVARTLAVGLTLGGLAAALALVPDAGSGKLLLGTALFAVGCASVLAILLPGATELRLDDRGFETRQHFRRQHYAWSEVSAFEVIQIGRARHVAFDLAPDRPPRGAVGRLNAALTGRNAFLDFAMDPRRLCLELNERRERALHGTEPRTNEQRPGRRS